MTLQESLSRAAYDRGYRDGLRAARGVSEVVATGRLAKWRERFECDVSRYVSRDMEQMAVSTVPQPDEYVRWDDAQAMLQDLLRNVQI